MASLLVATLLVTEQGLSFYAAAADVVEGPREAPRVILGGTGNSVQRVALPENLKTGSVSERTRLEIGVAAATVGLPVNPTAIVAALEVAPAGPVVAIEGATPAPSSDQPAAGPGALEADEKKSAQGVFSGLRRMLSGPKAAADEKTIQAFDGGAVKRPLDADNLTAVLIRPGERPVTTTLAKLRAVLGKGDYAAAFNKNGHLRVVLANGDLGGPALSEADVQAVRDAVRGAGLNVLDKRTRTEAIHVSLEKPGAAPARSEGAPTASAAARPRSTVAQYVVRGAIAAAVIGTYYAVFGATNILGMFLLAGIVSHVDRLVRETGYSLAALKAAMRESGRPRWTEVVGGLVSKVIPAVINVGVFATMYHKHPLALALSVALSLAVETFHGVWVNAWDTFQSKIGRHRGPLFQNLFNFFYGQIISGSYRTIAFFALAMDPPWSLGYWKPMIVMTMLGTFFGTLGYRGLNSLYEKGRLPRKGRAGIQQARDLLMMIVGPFFATGNMFVTWLVFSAQQSIDLAIYFIDRRTQTRPIVYVADMKVAQSGDFRKIYLEERSSAVKDALEGVKGFILVKPFVALYHWARGRRRS